MSEKTSACKMLCKSTREVSSKNLILSGEENNEEQVAKRMLSIHPEICVPIPPRARQQCHKRAITELYSEEGERTSMTSSASSLHKRPCSEAEQESLKLNVSGSSLYRDKGPKSLQNILNAKLYLLNQKQQRLRAVKDRYIENVLSYMYVNYRGDMIHEYSLWRIQNYSAKIDDIFKTYPLDIQLCDKNVGSEVKVPHTESSAICRSPCKAQNSIGALDFCDRTSVNAKDYSAHVNLKPNSNIEAPVNLSANFATPGKECTNISQAGAPSKDLGYLPKLSSHVAVSGITENLRKDLQNEDTIINVSDDKKQDCVSHISPLETTHCLAHCDKSSKASESNVDDSCTGDQSALPKEISKLQGAIASKASQEVYVIKRINELQRDGLWSEKRLPKLQEPNRSKMHWDYLLEEMVWMSSDFAGERKLKKAAAKKCSKMIQKYFHDKETAAQRAEKAREIHIRRLAAFLAREVRLFWSNVEKFVEYKNKTKIEESRKKALDQHLNFIVNQTEKFSQQLAEGMNKSLNETDTKNCDSFPKPTSDDEFRPDSPSEDDEDTIAREEEENDTDVCAEVKALEMEAEIPLNEFLHDLPQGYLESRTNATSDTSFAVSVSDNETQAATPNNRKSNEPILEQIKGDSPLLVTPKYALNENIGANILDSDDDTFSDTETESGTLSSDDYSEDSISNTEFKETELKSLFSNDAIGKDEFTDAAALAESLQPKGNTLSSTKVVTPIPFLLKHTLREYQHIGLDWLVTMNEQKLNGVLADEMGLGKTIQTIALLAHLACAQNNWGPHLIVVPSSVMLNWEMEFKKWCPAFKILTYYGSQKERKFKRVGWTKPNAFHICITSYKLVVQDQQAFRRKKWKYLILDEAQNIKNFKSQRWQLLQNFSTERRLLLTGTPLQNDLMELWSLMHFLMPSVFRSHRQFQEWFSNPMSVMIEGNMEFNESLINRLHQVIRPFLLRRLKKEVEKQMPKKYEHIIICRLSNRQRYLYDDFMSNSRTKETLQSGNSRSVINILMQLRKVCNHPNMFEMRQIISPFQMRPIIFEAPSLVLEVFEYKMQMQALLRAFNMLFIELETDIPAYVCYKFRTLKPPTKLIEEIDSSPALAPYCPAGKYKFHVRIRDPVVYKKLQTFSTNIVKVGASPKMEHDGNKIVQVQGQWPHPKLVLKKVGGIINPINTVLPPTCINQNKRAGSPLNCVQVKLFKSDTDLSDPQHSEKPSIEDPNASKLVNAVEVEKALASHMKASCNGSKAISLPQEAAKYNLTMLYGSSAEEELSLLDREKKNFRLNRLKQMAYMNQRRLEAVPIYGSDFRDSVMKFSEPVNYLQYSSWLSRGYINCCISAEEDNTSWSLRTLIKSPESRFSELGSIFNNFLLYIPAASSPVLRFHTRNLASWQVLQKHKVEVKTIKELSPKLNLLHPIISATNTQFPHPRLIQYDCGKLQTLDGLLRQLKKDGHRVLLFTQMTKMLDILEVFLNYHGYIYLRLDGSTRIDQRQVLMERFNGDQRIFCFILSTRSGGVGINLTGADTVIFYDSDWNPTMDAQAQDRCHRIGQTRDVHIYRLISENTIEVNILKKANQKRMLCDMAIEDGNFTTSFFKRSTIKDLFNMEQLKPYETTVHEKLTVASATTTTETLTIDGQQDTDKQSLRAYESALAEVEDELDVLATTTATAEVAADLAEFDETIPIDESENGNAELSKADYELQKIIKQLKPIERYAMRRVEEDGAAWTAQQIRVVEEEIEAHQREWEAKKLAEIRDVENAEEEENDDFISYDPNVNDKQVNCIQKSKNLFTKNTGKANAAMRSRVGSRVKQKSSKSAVHEKNVTKFRLSRGNRLRKEYGVNFSKGIRAANVESRGGACVRKSARLSLSTDPNSCLLVDANETCQGNFSSTPRSVRSVSKELKRLGSSFVMSKSDSKPVLTRRLLCRLQAAASVPNSCSSHLKKKMLHSDSIEKESSDEIKLCNAKMEPKRPSIDGKLRRYGDSSNKFIDPGPTNALLSSSSCHEPTVTEQTQSVTSYSDLEQSNFSATCQINETVATKIGDTADHFSVGIKRCTRSRGSVDINLWALDENLSLPDLRHSTHRNHIKQMGKIKQDSVNICESVQLKKGMRHNLKIDSFNKPKANTKIEKVAKHSMVVSSSSTFSKGSTHPKGTEKSANSLLSWISREAKTKISSSADIVNSKD